jgi:hypothetical protein
MNAQNRTRRLRRVSVVALALAAGTARAQVVDAYWSAAIPGDWDNPLRWSTNPVFPNNNAGVRYRAIFQASGLAYTVQLRQRAITVDDVVLDSPDATLLVGSQGVLKVQNRLDLRRGTFRLGSGSRIEGGTIVAQPGSDVLLGGGGEIRGVSLSGAFPIDGLTVTDGLSGDATLVFEPFPSTLTFSGDQTFSGGSILIPDTTQSQRRIRMPDHASLTIGPGAEIRGGESIIGNNEESFRSNGTLRNQGRIIADAPNRTMNIAADSFANEGLVEARAGTIRIEQPNRPSQAVWSNTGIMKVSAGATLFLGGRASTAALGSFDNAGTIIIGGVIDNAGRTLVMGPAEGQWRFSGNTSRIEGGTILAQPGARFMLAGGGELRGVSLSGLFPVDNVTITEGLSGDATLTFEPAATLMTFSGTQTFSGGTVVIPGATPTQRRIRTTGHSSLTIGPGAEIRGGEAVIGHNEDAFRSNGTLRNQGRIIADAPGRTIVIGADSFANEGLVEARGGVIRIQQPVRPGQAVWSNTGQIRAVGGGRVELSGIVTTSSMGTLDTSGGSLVFSSLAIDNRGETLHLGPTTGNVSGKFTIKGGVLDIAPGYSLTVQDFSTLDGVTARGDIHVAGGRALSVRNGLTLNGTVHLANPSSALYFAGSGNVLTSGTVLFEGPAGDDRLLSGDDQTLSSFVIGEAATVSGGRGAVRTSSHATTIENRGLISADTPGQSIRIHTARFSNTGTVEAVNGGILEYLNPPGLEGDGAFVNSGVLLVGADSGLRAQGDFVNDPGAVLKLFLHWSGSSPLEIDGVATLGGELEVLAAGDRVPRLGKHFTLIAAGGLVGEFDHLRLPRLDGGLSWRTDLLSVSGEIRVIPAPASLVLVLGYVVPAARRRRDPGRDA